ncbi:MAG: hypothetical protein AAF391_02530, partial [Bacteroidota bacterium]
MGLKRLLYISFIGLIFSLTAQNKDFQEEVHLSLNTTNILAAETLNFSAFIYSNKTKKLSKLSSVLYVELIDKTGRSIFQTKIGLRNGRGAGSIYMNPEWASDTYRIVAYTRWMKNYESYFEQKLLILNPYNGLIRNDSIEGDPLKWGKSLIKDANAYNPLARVSIDLGDIQPSSLAISIQKATNWYYPNEARLNNPKAQLDTYSILPEYRYALIQGEVSKSSEEPNDLRVNMTVKGSSMQIATTKTDEQGRFWMSYNPDFSASDGEVQIEVEDEFINDVSIVDEFYHEYPQLSSGKTPLDSLSVSELIDRSIHSQVQKAYAETPTKELTDRNSYISQHATSYYLDEYTRFSSTRDTFIEIAAFAGVSKNEDNYKMIVRCEQIPELADKDAEPLLLLDGLRVTAEDILKQSPNTIEKIEVLSKYYFVDDIVYAGAVSVHSYAGKKFDYTPLGKTFSITDFQPYADSVHSLKIDENHPVYESNLFWDPMYTHAGGDLNLEFPTSRLTGSYIISVSGITQSGMPVNLTHYFRVAE